MQARHLAAFSVVALIWGTTWLAIKVVVREMPPVTAAGMRFAVAALALAAFTHWRGHPLGWRRMPAEDRRLLLILSFLMFAVPYALIFYGEQYITSALTAILFASAPAFTLLFDSLHARKNLLTGTRLLGFLLAFGGILTIFVPRLSGPPAELGGAVVVVAAAATSSVALVLAKYGAHHINTYVGTTWQMGGGALWLLLVGLAWERPAFKLYSLPAVAGVLYLAIFGSCITFVLFYGLLKHMAPVQLSTLAFITPVVAVFVGWLILDEVLAPNTWVGAALVLAGVAVLTRRKPEPPPVGD